MLSKRCWSVIKKSILGCFILSVQACSSHMGKAGLPFIGEQPHLARAMLVQPAGERLVAGISDYTGPIQYHADVYWFARFQTQRPFKHERLVAGPGPTVKNHALVSRLKAQGIIMIQGCVCMQQQAKISRTLRKGHFRLYE